MSLKRQASNTESDHISLQKKNSLLVFEPIKKVKRDLEPVIVYSDDPVENEDLQTKLHLCLLLHQRERAIALIEEGANIHQKDKYERTPLHYSIGLKGIWDVPGLVKGLLSRGVDVNSSDNEHNNPLHWAAKYGSGTRTITLLIKAGADVSAINKYGRTALHLITHSNPKVFKLLIESGCDPHQTDFQGWTSLHWGVKNLLSINCIQVLLDNFSNINVVNDEGRTPLHLCMKFIKKGVEPMIKGDLDEENFKAALLLIEKGADFNIQDNKGLSCLHYAIRNKCSYKMVSMLLEKGADPNLTANPFKNIRRTALHFAIQNKDSTLIKILLSCPKTIRTIDLDVIHIDFYQKKLNEFESGVSY